jgi:hypothetical protein
MHMSVALRVAGLVVLSAVTLASAQPPADKKDAKPAAAKWTVLFRSDDPAVWGKNAKNRQGQQVAIPLRFAPDNMRYLRLRRMDTGEAQILPMGIEQLENGKPGGKEDVFWWNGSAVHGWGGFHLGIVQSPRYKWPELPKAKIFVMNEGWDGFIGSGFGHKCGVNDGQYYCWRGKEIRRTVFEIAVSVGPLSPTEKRDLVAVP